MKRDRLEKVLGNMREMGIRQLLVTAPTSVLYLTGKRVAPGERMLALLISDDGRCRLFANRLFALKPMDGCELIEYSDTDDCVGELSSRLAPGSLGVDKDWPCRFLLPLMEKRRDLAVSLGSPAVDSARMRKTEEELNLMRLSSRMNDAVIGCAIDSVRAGATEKDVAECYAGEAAAQGASGESFPSLICFGANCAEPHHDTGRTVLKNGDSVILDVGLVLDDYCSDMTRTVFYAAPTDEQKRVYDLVLRANEAGRRAVRPGVPLKEIDRAARSVIEDAGYGAYFIHRTGHGIGLDVHEFPDVSASSEAVCAPGMVFSVEPGVYLPGRFGVRIEDLVAVTEDGGETLNVKSHEMKVIEC